jgi:FAD/FMN-containing dehydrogenase
MMDDTNKPTLEGYLRAAGPVLADRKENPTGSLSVEQKTALQEATVAVVNEFRKGRAATEIQTQLAGNGWKPEVADGFIALVSQLMAKMYLQRTWIFAALAVLTSMLASIAVPQAAAGEFPWIAAGFSLIVATVSILATLRNLQLFRRYR